ncbi:Molybdopterin-synthase adenylyltransferase [Rubripirellula lacrimiformis]|uniref:Molybdopterin-synthase adenylyltransferase n=1 Tax=Rubripirellula lacrimiformis TaxID=1930273 RepID=A0A517N429_9BACT|nr:ThiF family adenylyltransferase [Rubripirellula lacrimiformis]QDT01895.1 Molybdopterin-synthase adenylyltransferase [Rubripirellula lacrimiformis]
MVRSTCLETLCLPIPDGSLFSQPIDMTDSPENRYARQIQFAPIGADGHAGIAGARVAVLGCGALGTVAAEILARAGVGTLRLIDRDVVEWTNLQRQALYTEADARQGRSKSAAATDRIAAINQDVTVDPVVADVSSKNIASIIGNVDLVVDAADNFALRFLLNDWSLSTETPWVHGGCVGASGQVRLFTGQGRPCFRCVVPEPPPASAVDTCDTAGVLGAATHLIASLQAAEAIKWISGNRQAVRTSMLSIDLWNNRIREIELTDELSIGCIACDRRDYQFLEGERGSVDESAAVLCGRDAVQISRAWPGNVDFDAIAARWNGLGRIQMTPFFARLFPDDQHTITLFGDGRVVVGGTDQISEARGLCDRYIGG